MLFLRRRLLQTMSFACGSKLLDPDSHDSSHHPCSPDGSEHSETEIRLVSLDKDVLTYLATLTHLGAWVFVVHGIPGGTDGPKYIFRRCFSSGCRDLCFCGATSDAGARSQDTVSQHGTSG